MRDISKTQGNNRLIEQTTEPNPQVDIEKDPFIIIYKFLNKANIKVAGIRKLKIAHSKWSSLRYFQLINDFFKNLQKYHPTSECSSIEIYHRNGHPMVTSPSDYFKLLHEFDEEDFKFLFILPKNLCLVNHSYVSTPASSIEYVPITHKESHSEHTVVLPIKTAVYVKDLKCECSSRFHLPYSSLSINLEHPDGTMECNLSDNVGINVINIQNQDYKLYLIVSENYWEPNYLDAFKFDNYTPTTKLSEDTLIYLNLYLLFLVKQVHLEGSLDIIKGNLCLLRKMSCSPPLVHSLWLLFMQKSITLPHKIAIIEGLITTINLLDVTIRCKDNFNFPCLWTYLERNTDSSYLPSESDEIFQLERNTSLLNESDILKNREIPYIQHNYLHFMKDFNSKSSTFTFLHPLDLYKNFLLSRKCNGLTRIRHNGVMTPCVLSSCAISPDAPILECYSPYHGDAISFNPFVVDTCEEIDTNKYSKLLIILDVSNDMHSKTFDGYNYIRPNISLQNAFFQLETALFLIDIIVDTLYSRNFQYLLGITLVSNDHGFENGYCVFQELTLCYDSTIRKLRHWIQSLQIIINSIRPPNGGMCHAFNHYLGDKYSDNTEIYIFTNKHHTERYYGSAIQRLTDSILNKSYRIYTIMFGGLGTRFDTLCRISQGCLLNSKSFIGKSAKNPEDPMYYVANFIEYVNRTRELLTEDTTPSQICSFHEVNERYKNHLSEASTLLTNKQLCTTAQNRVTSSILERISKYLITPNPFVSLYCINDDIREWLLFFRSPPNTDFYESDHVVSLTFSDVYLHKPPTLQFLTPILHPNIHRNGKICHPILLEDYDPHTTTLKTIINSIHSMLCKPIRSHVINRAIGELFLLGTDMYKLQILSVKDEVCMKSIPRKDREKILNITLTASATPTPPPPAYLICPLTKELFHEPVISPDGNTFENSAILEYLVVSPLDPISNNPLTEELLFPNYAIADCVRKYENKFH